MGVLNFFAKRQEILSSNGFLSVERSFLYTHPNTRDPSQVQSKRPFAYEKGILWPFRWQQNSLAPVEICRLAPIQPEVITCLSLSLLNNSNFFPIFRRPIPPFSRIATYNVNYKSVITLHHANSFHNFFAHNFSFSAF